MSTIPRSIGVTRGGVQEGAGRDQVVAGVRAEAGVDRLPLQPGLPARHAAGHAPVVIHPKPAAWARGVAS